MIMLNIVMFVFVIVSNKTLFLSTTFFLKENIQIVYNSYFVIISQCYVYKNYSSLALIDLIIFCINDNIRDRIKMEETYLNVV